MTPRFLLFPNLIALFLSKLKPQSRDDGAQLFDGGHHGPGMHLGDAGGSHCFYAFLRRFFGVDDFAGGDLDKPGFEDDPTETAGVFERVFRDVAGQNVAHAEPCAELDRRCRGSAAVERREIVL